MSSYMSFVGWALAKRTLCFPTADRTFCTNPLALLYNCTGVQKKLNFNIPI